MIKIEDNAIKDILLNWSNFGFYKSQEKPNKSENSVKIKGDFCKCPFSHRAPIYYSKNDKKIHKKTQKNISEIRNGLRIKRKNPRIDQNEYPKYNPDDKIEDFLEDYRKQISYMQLKKYDSLPIRSLINLKENSSSESKNSNVTLLGSHSNLNEIKIRLNSACKKISKNIKKSPKNKIIKLKELRKNENKNKIKYSISIHNVNELVKLKKINIQNLQTIDGALNSNLNSNLHELEKNLKENTIIREKENNKELQKEMQKKRSSLKDSSFLQEPKDIGSLLTVVSLSKDSINEKNNLIKTENTNKIKKTYNKSKQVYEENKIAIKKHSELTQIHFNKNFNDLDEQNNPMIPQAIFNQIENKKLEKLETLKKKFERVAKKNCEKSFKEDITRHKEKIIPDQKDFLRTNRLLEKEPIIKSIQTTPRNKVKDAIDFRNLCKDKKTNKITTNVFASTSPRKEIYDCIAKSEYLKFLGIGDQV